MLGYGPKQTTAPLAAPPPVTADWPEEENLLFRTQIAGRWIAFDPWRIGRVLARELAGEPLVAVLAAVRGEQQPDKSYRIVDHEGAFAAGERLYAAVCAAFELTPVQPDGSGIPGKVAMRVFNEYCAWKTAVKKNIAGLPTSSPSAASGRPSAPAS